MSEAYTRDVGRGVARMDYKSMGEIGASTGDVVEIDGRRRTVARCLPLYPSDEGKGMIRIDGVIRTNSGIATGGAVRVGQADAADAAGVVVEPSTNAPSVDGRFIADALENVPLAKGDIVMVPYFGGRVTYRVLGMKPEAPAVLVTQHTYFSVVRVKAPRGAGGRGGTGGAAPAPEDPAAATDGVMRLAGMAERLRSVIRPLLDGASPTQFAGAQRGVIVTGASPEDSAVMAESAARECGARLVAMSHQEIVREEGRLRRGRAKEGGPPPYGALEDARVAGPFVVLAYPTAVATESAADRSAAASALLAVAGRLRPSEVAAVVAASPDPGSVLPGLRESGIFGAELAVGGGPLATGGAAAQRGTAGAE